MAGPRGVPRATAWFKKCCSPFIHGSDIHQNLQLTLCFHIYCSVAACHGSQSFDFTSSYVHPSDCWYAFSSKELLSCWLRLKCSFLLCHLLYLLACLQAWVWPMQPISWPVSRAEDKWLVTRRTSLQSSVCVLHGSVFSPMGYCHYLGNELTQYFCLNWEKSRGQQTVLGLKSCFWKYSFIGTQSMLFTDALFIRAAFLLQWQGWVIVTKTLWSASLKYLWSGPFGKCLLGMQSTARAGFQPPTSPSAGWAWCCFYNNRVREIRQESGSGMTKALSLTKL